MPKNWFKTVTSLPASLTAYVPRTRKAWLKVMVVLALILLPIAIGGLYRAMTAFPEEITIATGQRGGLYLPLGRQLAAEIEKRLRVKVRIVKTKGSLENLLRLRGRNVDFALYQPGTLEALHKHDPSLAAEAEEDVKNRAGLSARPAESARVAFVANLYSQPAHFIVRRGAGIESPADLKKDTTVGVGLTDSGDYAMSLMLLKDLGLDRQSVTAKHLTYEEVEDGFRSGRLDAVFITMGVQAPVLPELFETGTCDLVEIPCADALTMKHVSMSKYTIPKGLYRLEPPEKPSDDVETVALAAQLLTRSDVHAGLVEEVARIVLSEGFVKENQLGELFTGGHEFARHKPEFPIHLGAQRFYDPALRPLLPTDFVESTEGIRSFAVSVLIAVFFGIRWLRQRRIKRKEHRLDRFIRALLEIERRQVALDTGENANDVQSLQKLLDDVTSLRQDALGEFSAHELNEERAAECLIEMSHDLSNNINAKISRQRLDMRFDQLAEAINRPSRPTPD